MASVCALNGSLRPHGMTRRALVVALEGAALCGAHTRLIDLWDYGLPLCDGSDGTHDGVLRLRADVRCAHAMLWGTPEYHGSMSGALKNALDWLGFGECEGKIVGLVSVSGGALGGVEALTALRTVGRSLHAWVVPDQVLIPYAGEAFDGAQPKDPRALQRLHHLGAEVARFAALHGSKHYEQFIQEWQRAQDNPGGDAR